MEYAELRNQVQMIINDWTVKKRASMKTGDGKWGGGGQLAAFLRHTSFSLEESRV